MTEKSEKFPEGAKMLDDKKHFHLSNEKYGKKETPKEKIVKAKD